VAAYGLLLLLLTLSALLVVGLAFLYRLRRPGDGEATSSRDEARAQRKYLVSNWEMVERAARESGMTAEELDEVRRKIFAAE
jgi:hypothetical protein